MHKVDQTVLDAIGIYEASCEAAGAPISAGAKIAAVSAALATHATPEEVTSRLMQFACREMLKERGIFGEGEPPKGATVRVLSPDEFDKGVEAAASRVARKPRASKGAK